MSQPKQLCLGAIILALSSSAATAQPIDIASWVRTWPATYHVSGFKNEPTYLAAIDIERRGDLFTIVGGAPAWAERAVEAVEVHTEGGLRHTICPAAMTCDDGSIPSGFLASAALLSAARSGRPLGTAEAVPYGARMVVCIPAERIGIREPILDPCFDTITGAVLAQRHRLTAKFDGPSLDPWSIRFDPSASETAETK